MTQGHWLSATEELPLRSRPIKVAVGSDEVYQVYQVLIG